MDVTKLFIEQQNAARNGEDFDVRLFGRDRSTGVEISSTTIKMRSDGIEQFRFTNQGSVFYQELQNPGSVANETKTGFQVENILKEFMFPSSTVTPIPEHVAFPVVQFKAKAIADAVKSIKDLVSFLSRITR